MEVASKYSFEETFVVGLMQTLYGLFCIIENAPSRVTKQLLFFWKRTNSEAILYVFGRLKAETYLQPP